MSSQRFNSASHEFCLDLNVLPSTPAPSSLLGPQPLLPNRFRVMGGVGDTDPEWSDMGFQILSPSMLHPQESMLTRRSNDEGDDGYPGVQNRSKLGKEVEVKSPSAMGKGENIKLCNRGHWKPAEDDKLKELVTQFGPQNWNLIAQHIEGRSGKSCRLRWFNQLDPRINKRAFTEEEERRLLAAHRLYGNKWAMISRLFPGRTDNAVKNHWHVIMARRQREQLNGYRRRNPTLNQSNPNGLTLNIPNNAASGSTISCSIDESASTNANLTGTPSSTSLIPMPFNNPILVQNHHAYGSIMGLSGERRVATGDFGFDKVFGAWNSSHEPGPTKKPMGALDKSNYSNSDSEVSVSELVATNMIDISIPMETKNMRAKANMSFIDFLGAGDT